MSRLDGITSGWRLRSSTIWTMSIECWRRCRNPRNTRHDRLGRHSGCCDGIGMAVRNQSLCRGRHTWSSRALWIRSSARRARGSRELAGDWTGVYAIPDRVRSRQSAGHRSTWDAIHTFIRIPAGAVLAAAAFANLIQRSHRRSATGRYRCGWLSRGEGGNPHWRTLSPEPFSNFALSLLEDMVVIGSSILMAFHPVVLIAIVTLFLCAMVWLFPKIIRTVRNCWKGAFAK